MVKPDEGHILTEKALAKLEKKIESVYGEAAKEMQTTIDEYFSSFAKRDEEMRSLIGSEVNGKEWTKEDYKKWRLNQIGRGKRMEALRDKIAERVTEANETAVAYVNDATPGIYSLNRNYTAYTIEQISPNADFTLWDEQTVKRLITESPDLMPYYPKKMALKRGIDLEYGKKQITASITSSILQGKSIKHIADDLQERITTMSRASAIRTARTAVTGAQNAGRMDSYKAAEDMGIKLQKQWLSTLDNRTRHAHAMLDGQTVDTDKPFKVDGYELMYPGDRSAPGYLLYNCRCTTIAVLPDVDTSDAQRWSIDPETGERKLASDMSYQEWAGWKEKEQKTVANSVQSGIVKSEWDNDLTPRGQLPHIDEDDLYSFVAGELGVSEQRATEYTDAVMAFTDNSGLFTDVRKYQRGESLDEWADMEAVKAISRDAEEYIKIAPRWNAGETFRGVTISDDELASYTNGSVINMGGMASWSSKMSISADFAVRNTTYGRPNSVLFHCGTQSKGTAIRHLSVLEIEDEVLCSKDAKYKIIRQEKHDDGIIHIFLEEVQ